MAQYKEKFEWLKEVESLVLANAQINLQTVYNIFSSSLKSVFQNIKNSNPRLDFRRGYSYIVSGG